MRAKDRALDAGTSCGAKLRLLVGLTRMPLFTCLSLVLLWGGGRTVRDEASELQAVGVPENDPNPAKHFTPLPEDVYKSHRQLEEIARVYTLPLPSQAWLRKLHQTCVIT